MAGWVWLGASERGAFGFSNEKSLMYWPSTLSCGAVCCCGGCCASPPLVVDVIRYLRRNGTALPLSAAWLTQAHGLDKDGPTRTSGIRAHGPPLPSRRSSIASLRDLIPLVGRKIDDGGSRAGRAGGFETRGQ